MAIFRPGALIGGISGALGGVTFSNSRGSRVVRHRPAVKGGNAPRHGQAQAAFRYAQSAWATLTDQQRTSWRTYAPQAPVTNRLGEQHALSGFQTFVRFNIRTRMLNLPLSTTPTSSHDHPAPTSLQITSGIADGIEIKLLPDVISPIYLIFLYGAMRMSLTPPTAYSNWRLLDVKFVAGDLFTPITADWETAWTLPELGQPIGIRVDSYTRDMRISSSLVQTATTTA